jgi:hypothetical protein
MKKLLIITLTMLLVLGATAVVFATDTTLNGSIRVRGEWNNNITDADNERGDNAAGYDQRVRLGVDSKVTKNTTGVIELESGAVGNDLYNWGAAANASGTLGGGHSKTTSMWLRKAYITHSGSGLFGSPATLTVGHLPVKLGRGIFLDHTKFGDDALSVQVTPSDGTNVSLTHLKFTEGNVRAAGANTFATDVRGNDDINTYTLAASTAVGGANLGIDITYVDAQDFTFVLPNQSVVDTGTEPLHLFNIGLRGDTDLSGVKLYADLEIQTGSAKSSFNDRVTNALSKRTYKGYAWMLGATADVSNIDLGLEVAYGSGDKRDYSIVGGNANDGTVNWDSGSKNEMFMNTLSADEQTYTYVYNDRMVTAAGAANTGLANTWYVNLGADTEINPDLSVGGDIYVLRASKAANIGGARNANGTLMTSKSVGTEIDTHMNYQIDTNFVYFVNAGYLFTGAAYDTDDNTVAANGTNKNSDNAYVVRHGVSLTF